MNFLVYWQCNRKNLLFYHFYYSFNLNHTNEQVGVRGVIGRNAMLPVVAEYVGACASVLLQNQLQVGSAASAWMERRWTRKWSRMNAVFSYVRVSFMNIYIYRDNNDLTSHNIISNHNVNSLKFLFIEIMLELPISLRTVHDQIPASDWPYS